MIISYLKCTECNEKIPIPRKRGQMRENGHIKHMYCPYCKKITPFIEDKDLKYY